MTLKEFAEQNGLRVRKDTNGDLIVPGKFSAKDMPKRPEYSSHVYDGFVAGRLGVCLMFISARKFEHACCTLQAVDCQLLQHGQFDGCLLFDPANTFQAQAAIRAAGLKKRRIPSAAQIAVLERARAVPKAA